VKIKKNLFALFISFLFLSISSVAQTPPHPNGGNDPNSGNTPVGGGAPIGGSLVILLSLAIGYTAKRVYEIRNADVED